VSKGDNSVAKHALARPVGFCTFDAVTVSSSSFRLALRQGESLPDCPGSFPLPTMAAADSCPITSGVATARAVLRPLAEQVSPDKCANFLRTTPSFTLP